MKNGENPSVCMKLRTLAGVLVAAVAALGSPALAQPNMPEGEPAQESNPFVLKQPTARELPSILKRDAEGRVVWIEGDPSRKAIDVMDVSTSDRRTMERLLAERDAQLLRAAIPNTDKIVRALEAVRTNETMRFDAFGRKIMDSLGEFGRRGAYNYDAVVRRALPRGVYTDLNAIVREYNLARIAEERAVLLARAQEEDMTEILLRDSTILQRFQQLDVAADAARMLRDHFGGDEALAKAHPGLAATIEADGFWVAMSELGDEQLAEFVSDQTDLQVSFPSPEGGEALAPLARERQDPSVRSEVTGPSDAELEAMRAPIGDGPSVARRGPDGRVVRLERSSYIEAYHLMVANGSMTDADAERLRTVIEDRDRVFDEQALRLYEFLLGSASHGRVEEGPLEEAVLNREWRRASLMYGAWLNEQLPAPSTFHNDLRVREAIEQETLIELARIANEYDNGHIFDARVELLRMVRDDETMTDPRVAMPANIKRPWRLQQIIRDAKASYARQLRVTAPEFRGILAELDVEPEVANTLRYVVAADGPMTELDFWEVAVKLPLSAHRELIQKRTGYEAPEPGFFEGKTPVPATGSPGR